MRATAPKLPALIRPALCCAHPHACTQLYIYLTVAFLEMSRAALPVIVMLMLWASRIEVPTPTITRAVLLTAAGCAIAAYGEMHLNLLGIFFCVINLGMEAVRVVLMQVSEGARDAPRGSEHAPQPHGQGAGSGIQINQTRPRCVRAHAAAPSAGPAP